MEIFGYKIEKRAESEKVSNSDTEGIAVADDLLRALLSDEPISREQALEIPSVRASINLIADTISALPVMLYKTSEGDVKPVVDDKRCYLLNYDTRDTFTATQFWRAMIEDYYLGKGAYAYIHKRFTEFVSIHHVKNEHISFQVNTDPIFKDYDICVNGKRYAKYDFLKILRNSRDGRKSVPIQEENKTIMSVAYHEMLFEKTLVETGGGKKGFVTLEKVNDITAITDLKRKLLSLFKPNGECVAVFNKGADFKELSTTPTEMQLNENKETNSVELSMLFKVPNALIRGNATQKDIDNFVDFCIIPFVADIEASLDRDLLTETEKEEGYHFFFDVKELKRGNIKERYEAYEIGCRNNFLQVDEIREKEDLKPLGFKYMKLGLDSVLYDIKTGEIYTPNTNKTTNMEKLKKGEGQTDESGTES